MIDFPSYCTTHQREVTQDHLLYYDRLNSLYGQQILGELCICHAIWAFKDPVYRRGFDTDLSYKRKKEALDMLEAETKRKTEEKLESAGRWYFITFTCHESEKDPSRVLKATTRLLRSKQVSPIQWCYSLELTEKGTPHTHIRLFSNKYFDYKKIGNFNDGYRYDVQKEKMNCSKYIIKEESKPSEEWLKSYGLDTYFWSSETYTGAKPGSSEFAPDKISLELI